MPDGAHSKLWPATSYIRPRGVLLYEFDVTKGDGRKTMTNMDDWPMVGTTRGWPPGRPLETLQRVRLPHPASRAWRRPHIRLPLALWPRIRRRRSVSLAHRLAQAALDSTCSASRAARSASRRAEIAT